MNTIEFFEYVYLQTDCIREHNSSVSVKPGQCSIESHIRNIINTYNHFYKNYEGVKKNGRI